MPDRTKISFFFLVHDFFCNLAGVQSSHTVECLRLFPQSPIQEYAVKL